MRIIAVVMFPLIFGFSIFAVGSESIDPLYRFYDFAMSGMKCEGCNTNLEKAYGENGGILQPAGDERVRIEFTGEEVPEGANLNVTYLVAKLDDPYWGERATKMF